MYFHITVMYILITIFKQWLLFEIYLTNIVNAL